MQLPSSWSTGLVHSLAAYPDMRAAARAALDGYDVHCFDSEIQILLDRLFLALEAAPALAEEVDLFGNAHWYNYGSFNAAVAELKPAGFAAFVRARFTEHCTGALAEALAQMDEQVWELIVEMHFIYMLFSLYDKERCRKDFGLGTLGFKAGLRISTNPLARLISRVI
jgi:hypothetical protein